MKRNGLLKRGAYGLLTVAMMLQGMTAFAAEDSQQSSSVTADVLSSYSITIPKNIALSVDENSLGTGAYQVGVKGDIEGNQSVYVVPQAAFTMTEQYTSAELTANVSQDKVEWKMAELSPTEYLMSNGMVTANDVTPGHWEGVFYFNIEKSDVAPPLVNGLVDGGEYAEEVTFTVGTGNIVKVDGNTIDANEDGSYTVKGGTAHTVEIWESTETSKITCNITITHSIPEGECVCENCGEEYHHYIVQEIGPQVEYVSGNGSVTGNNFSVMANGATASASLVIKVTVAEDGNYSVTGSCKQFIGNNYQAGNNTFTVTGSWDGGSATELRFGAGLSTHLTAGEHTLTLNAQTKGMGSGAYIGYTGTFNTTKVNVCEDCGGTQ